MNDNEVRKRVAPCPLSILMFVLHVLVCAFDCGSVFVSDIAFVLAIWRLEQVA